MRLAALFHLISNAILPIAQAIIFNPVPLQSSLFVKSHNGAAACPFAFVLDFAEINAVLFHECMIKISGILTFCGYLKSPKAIWVSGANRIPAC